jgi:hypothetical protein
VKTTTVLTTLPEPAVSYLISQLQLVVWREGTKYYSQASHLVRPYQSSCLYANTKIGHQRNTFRTFTRQVKFLIVVVPCACFVLFSSVLLKISSLFSYPYSYPLHFPSFFFVIIYCSPSQLLCLLFSSTLCPIFTSPSYPSPTFHHTAPPSYTLTTHWLTYCTNWTHPEPPVIPDRLTLHYNRNAPKHTQGLQNTVTLIPSSPTHSPLFFPPFSTNFTNYPSFYI